MVYTNIYTFNYQLLDEVEQNIVICQWRPIIDLRDADKARYFAIAEFNNCFLIRSPSLFFKLIITASKRALVEDESKTIIRSKKKLLCA